MTNMSRPYQYAECGLDFVYLVGGFEIEQCATGDRIRIDNVEGLHKAIGDIIVRRKKVLSGKELRFLRHEMLMSQATLAGLLGVTEQAIHRWENGKTSQVPPTADALIRLLYREYHGEKPHIRQGLKRIADLEDEIDGLMTLVPDGGKWKEKKAA